MHTRQYTLIALLVRRHLTIDLDSQIISSKNQGLSVADDAMQVGRRQSEYTYARCVREQQAYARIARARYGMSRPS